MPEGQEQISAQQIAEESFRQGAQMMRELLARSLDKRGNFPLASAMRAIWPEDWAPDPGPYIDIAEYEQPPGTFAVPSSPPRNYIGEALDAPRF